MTALANEPWHVKRERDMLGSAQRVVNRDAGQLERRSRTSSSVLNRAPQRVHSNDLPRLSA